MAAMTTRKYIHEEIFDADPEMPSCDSAMVGRIARDRQSPAQQGLAKLKASYVRWTG